MWLSFPQPAPGPGPCGDGLYMYVYDTFPGPVVTTAKEEKAAWQPINGHPLLKS